MTAAEVEQITVADYILTRLAEAGVHRMYSVPGDYAAHFLDALDRFDGIERIGDVNELGCAYAADGDARLSGAAAACVQFGVGTFSALNAVAGSFVERAAVAVITGSPSTQDRELARKRGILFHHSTGNFAADSQVYQQVTVACEVLGDPAKAPAQIDHAVSMMLAHSRPIYLEAYQNVWTMMCPRPAGPLRVERAKSDPAVLEEAVTATWERLLAAKLPVVLAGSHIQRFGLQDILVEFLDVTGLPFTTTLLGKTVLDETHGGYAGTFAAQASLPETSDLMNESDCVLSLGAIFTDDYVAFVEAKYACMTASDVDGTHHGHTRYPDVFLTDFLQGLLKRAHGHGRPIGARADRLAPERGVAAADDGKALSYVAFFDALWQHLRTTGEMASTALILGESSSLYVASNYDGLPRNAFIAEAAWGSLGHETGCALGVARASGKRPIVIAGDGGFRMMAQSVATLAAENSDAVIFVMRNDAYAIEQAFVDLESFSPDGAFAPYDVFPTWDYGGLARAFGADGYRVETLADLAGLMKLMSESRSKPMLVEVVIPQKDLAPQIKALAEAVPTAAPGPDDSASSGEYVLVPGADQDGRAMGPQFV